MEAHQMYDLVIIAVGAPSAAIALIGAVAIARGWWIKAKEFRIQEKRIQMEERLRSDELGARILRSDDPGHANQIATLTEEIRQLRQEVSDLRRSVTSHFVG